VPDYCGGAGGRPRPVAPAVSYLVGAAAVAVTVETLGLSAIWADLIAYAAGQTFSPATLCPQVPPAMPVFGDQDVIDIVMSNPIASPVGWGKLADLVHIGAWLAFCECLDGSPPGIPAAPVYPPNGAVLTSPAIPGLTAGACWDRAFGVNIPIPSGGLNHGQDIGDVMLPTGGATIPVQNFIGIDAIAHAIPAGANSLHLAVTPNQTLSHGVFDLHVWNAAGTALTFFQIAYGTLTQGPQHLDVAALPTGAAFWSFAVGDGFPNQTVVEGYAVEFSFHCASSPPGTPVTDCCPPDPILMAQLQVIINLINGLHLGGGSPPLTGLLETAAHPGLTSGGTLILRADTIAVRVDITTDNPALPTAPGVPTYLFDRGFVVPIAHEGPIRTQTRLVYNPQLYYLPALADSVGYQLGVGIVATITELAPAP
jgi:hypothetical protein